MERISAFVKAMPDWLAALSLSAIAVVLGLLAYEGVAWLIVATTRRRGAFMRMLFPRIRGLLKMALILVALNFAAQLPYFPARASEIASKVFTAAVILLTGWAATIALDVASAFYLRRFKTGVEDNLLARKHLTQIRVLRRALSVLIAIITLGAALMTFEQVRQIGLSLFASAGAAGLVVGLAARPVLSNLLAGIQLAITQPIRLEDAVVVEGEWGWIEEITSTYVVIKLWDWRRLIVPLSYFMEKPFQNWTRETASIIGAVMLRLAYTVPVARLRAKLEEVVKSSKLWDGNVVNLQVTEFNETSVELRILVSARTSPQAWDLRCEVREKLLAFLQDELADSLPRRRLEVVAPGGHLPADG